MDLSTLKPSEEPQRLDLRHPGTGEPLLDGDGNAPFIMVYGQDSAAFQKRQRAIARRQIQTTERSRKFVLGSPEQTEADNLETAVSCTHSWGNIAWEGKDLPHSDENARMIYKEVPWIQDQVREFILDRSNFTKPSSPASSSEPAGSSPSRAPLRAVAGKPHSDAT